METTPAWDELDSAELARLQTGGVEAVAELFGQYQNSLERMIQVRLDKRLCGRIDPSDVLQEVFLEVSRRVSRYLAQPSVPAVVWLRQVTSQVLVNLHRFHLGAAMRTTQHEVSIDGNLNLSAEGLAQQFAAHHTSPSQAAMREETLRELHDALATMEPIDREILTLRHFEELNNSDVARILGLQKSAASNRYVRALARLKQGLERVASARCVAP